MNRFKICLLVLALGLVVATPASAQRSRSMVGISAGATTSDIEGGFINTSSQWGFIGGIFGTFRANRNSMIGLEAKGMVKVVAEAKYGQVLGVHIIGPGAMELIGEGALAVEMEASLDELAVSMRYHPTFSESQVDAAREALGRGIYVMR